MFPISPNFPVLYSFMLKTRLTDAENFHFIAFYFHEDKNICYHFFPLREDFNCEDNTKDKPLRLAQRCPRQRDF